MLMTCWMECNSFGSLEENWLTPVQLEGGLPFCYLLVQEQNQFLRLCLAFPVDGGVYSNENVSYVEIYLEGIHSSNRIVREMAIDTVWWCSEWVTNSLTRERLSCPGCHPQQFHLPFSQVILHFTTPLANGKASHSRDGVFIKEGEQFALTRLSNLLTDSTFADVTICVRGEAFMAHSAIVAAASPVMSAMFQHDFKENRTRIVNIGDTRALIFKQLLQYIYTGTVSGDVEEEGEEDITMDLFVAADKYGVDALKEECSIILLSRKFDVDNVVSILILAHLHSVPYLFNASINFMVKNNRIVCSHPDYAILMETYPKVCFQVNKCILISAGGDLSQPEQQLILKDNFCAAVIFLLIFALVIILLMFPHFLISLTSVSTDFFAFFIFLFCLYKD